MDLSVIMQWVTDNYLLVGSVLFGVSEALALIPAVQSNSVFQLIYNVLKRFKKNPE